MLLSVVKIFSENFLGFIFDNGINFASEKGSRKNTPLPLKKKEKLS